MIYLSIYLSIYLFIIISFIFHWSLSDSKSPPVSRTLLSSLVVLNNAAVWMVSTRPPTSNSSRPFNNPFVTVLKAPITIGIIVTFIFHSFFQFSRKVDYYYYYYYYLPLEIFLHYYYYYYYYYYYCYSTNCSDRVKVQKFVLGLTPLHRIQSQCILRPVDCAKMECILPTHYLPWANGI